MEFFELSRKFIRQLNRDHRRSLASPLAGPRNILTGPRGVGKSTWTAQYLIDRFPDYETSTECLYLPVDHFSLAGKSVYKLAEVFAHRGGRLLCLDEIHRAEAWARDLKSISDTFPKLEILATGSSLLHLQHGSHDLSRRFLLNRMEGLSFREHLALRHGMVMGPLTLDTVLEEHERLAVDILHRLEKMDLNVLAEFHNYLAYGYYPYSLEFDRDLPDAFFRTLQQSALASLEGDLPSLHPTLSGASIQRIRRLLAAIALNVPFTPDLSKLRKLLHIADDRTLKDYLIYLEEADLIYLLRRQGTPLRSMDKPDRIYYGDPNLGHALAAPARPNPGPIREIFFLRCLPPELPVRAANKGDFLLDERFIIEVGGRNKDRSQLRGTAEAWLALDDLPSGSGRRVPLWLFGFLR